MPQPNDLRINYRVTYIIKVHSKKDPNFHHVFTRTVTPPIDEEAMKKAVVQAGWVIDDFDFEIVHS